MSKELKIYGSISINTKRIKVDINDILFAIPFPKIIIGNDEDVVICSRAPAANHPIHAGTEYRRFDVHLEYRVVHNRFRPWTKRTIKVARVCLAGDNIEKYQVWEEEVNRSHSDGAVAQIAVINYANDFGKRTGTII